MNNSIRLLPALLLAFSFNLQPLLAQKGIALANKSAHHVERQALVQDVIPLARLANERLAYMKDVAAYKWAKRLPTASARTTIKVGYPPVSTSLPLFVAIEEGLFKEKGLNIESVQYETANQIVDALAAGEIQATSVCADYPWLSLAVEDDEAFRIYAWEILDTLIPFDLILSRPGSGIHTLADLEGKTIATFPGSQLKHYLELILEKALGWMPEVTIIEMAPADQIPALASGKVDALFTLEPMALMAVLQGVGQIVESSPISKYIGGGQPMPAASFALSTTFIKEHSQTAKKFVQAMDKAIRMINKDQEQYRYLYPRFTNITAELAGKIPVTHFTTVRDMDISLFQKEADILFKAGLLERRMEVKKLIYSY